jgi:phosphoribosylformylglycinamidine (FGAM) synthase-like enzyme
VYLIGEHQNDIASSQYLVNLHGVQQSPAPYFDLDKEYNVQQAVLNVIKKELIQSAHDTSEGGLFITLLESGMPRGLGVNINVDTNGLRNDALLFGEAQSRVVVSVKPENVTAFENELKKSGTTFSKLGEVKGNNIVVNGVDFGTVAEYANTFNTSLADLLNQ